jgi:hypothetical protein
MASEQSHALTRSEVEEALARYTQDAKAAMDAGNELRWARRHEQIDGLLAQWDALEAEEIAALRPQRIKAV